MIHDVGAVRQVPCPSEIQLTPLSNGSRVQPCHDSRFAKVVEAAQSIKGLANVTLDEGSDPRKPHAMLVAGGGSLT
jgi:hypothetical protein